MKKYFCLYEQILDLIKRKYCYLSKRKIQFRRFKRKIKKELIKIKNDQDFFILIGKSIKIFKDIHMRFAYNEKTIFPEIDQGRKNGQSTIVKKYLTNIKEKNSILIGKIKNIDYIGLNSFNSKDEKDYIWFRKYFPKSKKVIIDLRRNNGGNDTFINPLISYLFTQNKKSLSCYFRFRESEKNIYSLTEFKPKYIYPEKKLKNHFNKKVIVLIGNRTCSAGELATLDLKAINNTLLIGDITQGQIGMPRRFLVGGKYNGKQIKSYENPKDYKTKFAIDIPTRICYTSNKKIIQWKGIKPEIYISSKKSIAGDTDFVLEKAIKIIS